jgi:hypothetical protein
MNTAISASGMKMKPASKINPIDGRHPDGRAVCFSESIII